MDKKNNSNIWKPLLKSTTVSVLLAVQISSVPTLKFSSTEAVSTGTHLAVHEGYVVTKEGYSVESVLSTGAHFLTQSSSVPFLSFDMEIMSRYSDVLPGKQMDILKELVGVFSLSGKELPEDFLAPVYDI